MGTRVNYSGLVVAGLGFFLTRFTVTLAIYENPLRFYFAGILPLMLGLGLAAFGVALAVADLPVETVRTTAIWCVIGVATMFVLVVVTLLGSAGGVPDLTTVRSQAYLSNFLIGGAVGGTMTGLYAAGNRRHRAEIQHQANRLEVLNRLLRHEVLNAVTVIQGWNSIDDGDATEVTERIDTKSVAIVDTIEEVKYLARSTGSNVLSTSAVDVESCIRSSVATVEERNPGARVSIASCPSDLTVRATARVERVFIHLLENAISYDGDTDPEIEVTTTSNRARISVRWHGHDISDTERALLERGEIAEFDDPGTGLSLNLVRLFVEDCGGSIETDVEGSETTVTVVLSLAEREHATKQPLPSGLTDVSPVVPHLVVTLGSALLAGVAYGLVSESLGGSIAGIGVFYGAPTPLIGWITHEFHSVVFGFVFAGLVSLIPAKRRNTISAHVSIGIVWAVFLWFFAAGVIAPIWLRLLGIPAPIPNVSSTLLASHVVWGLSLGVLTTWGYEYVTPWLWGLVDETG